MTNQQAYDLLTAVLNSVSPQTVEQSEPAKPAEQPTTPYSAVIADLISSFDELNRSYNNRSASMLATTILYADVIELMGRLLYVSEMLTQDDRIVGTNLPELISMHLRRKLTAEVFLLTACPQPVDNIIESPDDYPVGSDLYNGNILESLFYETAYMLESVEDLIGLGRTHL